MKHEFVAEASPSPGLLERLSRAHPRNPFLTPSYVAARRDAGETPYAFILRKTEDGSVVGATGFVSSGLLSRALEIPSSPIAQQDFWTGLMNFCHAHRIWEARLGTFASEAMSIPPIGRELDRRRRFEYAIDLRNGFSKDKMSTNHKRNVVRAMKSGVTIRRSSEPSKIDSHLRLMGASADRRRARGEFISSGNGVSMERSLIESGAAELFQAVYQDKELSSILVLKAPKGAYYHTAGTSSDGMKLGASQYLISEVATTLSAEGCETFNLGGCDPENQGLRRFKIGFGAQEVALDATTAAFVPDSLLRLRSALRAMREDPLGVVNSLVALERYVVFSADPRCIPSSDLPIGYEFRKLTDAEVWALEADDEFSQHAARCKAMAFNGAYGLFVTSELVHVAWCIDAETDARAPVRNVRLRKGEAEITHCQTKVSRRGQGLYPIAVRQLCQVLREKRITRAFMITGIQNGASQRGIDAAGLARHSFIWRVHFPRVSKTFSLTLRGHRWLKA